MKEYQKLGKQLVQAPEYLLKKINMDDDLANAISLARRLSNDGSMRRQLQYIGKLLSKIDTDNINKILDTNSLQHQNINKEFHIIEQWRDKLIKDGNSALNDLINDHPDLDRQHLRQLIRNAQKEEALQKPPTSSRAIFRYLKENIKFNSPD